MYGSPPNHDTLTLDQAWRKSPKPPVKVTSAVTDKSFNRRDDQGKSGPVRSFRLDSEHAGVARDLPAPLAQGSQNEEGRHPRRSKRTFTPHFCLAPPRSTDLPPFNLLIQGTIFYTIAEKNRRIEQAIAAHKQEQKLARVRAARVKAEGRRAYSELARAEELSSDAIVHAMRAVEAHNQSVSHVNRADSAMANARRQM